LVPPTRRFDPEEFARLRGADRLDPVARRRLRELFVARERLAEARDLPPFKVIGPDTLVTVARLMPADETALAAIPGMTPRLVDRCGAELLRALRRAARLRPIPPSPSRDGDSPGLTIAQRGAYDRLRAWRKQTALARGVDASLILPRPVMQQLVELRSPPRDLESLTASGVLETWRCARYGAGIFAALRGGSVEAREREVRPSPPGGA
jgi:ribonuclease D